MSARDVRKFYDADETGFSLLQAADGEVRAALGRSFHRVLKIARMIADLEESETIRSAHIAEAIQYRGRDRSVL